MRTGMNETRARGCWATFFIVVALPALLIAGCSDPIDGVDGGDAGDSAAPGDTGGPVGDAATDGDVGIPDGGVDSGVTPDAGVDTGTPPPGGTFPVLYRFRVEAASQDRVYFASTEPITATTTDGFTISGKTISGVVINGTDLDGHYFTVTSPFDFWDNNTIRYEGGSDLEDADGNGLHDFTLRYIENHIPEPDATTDIYYVDAATSSSGDGSSEATAFKTISEAAALAGPGTMIWVKAGDYGNERVVLAASGTATDPVKLVGYQTTPGDSPTLTRSVGMAFDANEMPLLSGSGSGVGITTDNRYTIVRNMQVENYTDLIMGKGRDVLFSVFDNVYLQDGESGLYVNDNDSQNVRFINSYVADCSSKGIRIQNKHNLIDNVWSVSSRVVHEDYYISVYGGVDGGDNIIRRSYVHRFVDDTHTGHGISIKGGSPTFTHEHNLIEDCEIINSKNGSIEFRHSNVKYNVARGIYIHQDSSDYATYRSSGISFENGCSYNRVENSVIAAARAFAFTENEEDGSATQSGGDYNTIVNTLVFGSRSVIAAITPTVNTNNRFIGCTFHDTDYFVTQLSGTTTNMFDDTNEFIGCSISSLPDYIWYGSPTPTFVSGNFYESWGTEGAGATTHNPQYTDAATGDYTPLNTAMQAATLMSEALYDINDRERADPSTIGAFEMP